MLLPLLLALLAGTAAALLAYGTDPAWARFSHGIDFIMWSRRLQWPLTALALLLCIALLALIISGKRRAWWLLALSPILALFVHRFVTDPNRQQLVVEDPSLLDAAQSDISHDTDWIVGVQFDEAACAFPFSVLYHAPAVLLSDREKRMILLWSPFANRALAFEVKRDLRARDLEVVSSPANAVLLYNSKLGQFINCVTGLTPQGAKPADFKEPLPTVKMTWVRWKTAHPDTKLMAAVVDPSLSAPSQPVLPRYPLPHQSGITDENSTLCMIATTRPIALPSASLNGALLNLATDQSTLLIFRDNQGAIRAFDRHLEEDLSPRFSVYADPHHPEVALIDADTNTEWTATGIAVLGPPEEHGKKLTPVPAEDNLYWNVMKFWYPALQWAPPAALKAAVQPISSPHPLSKPVTTIRKHRKPSKQ